MQLGKQQAQAYDKIMRWAEDDNSPQIFRLCGYAGTGKTTLLKFLERTGVISAFLAPTGKAAQVLKSKLPPHNQVSTIHAALYTPIEATQDALDVLEKSLAEDPTNDAIKDAIKYHKEAMKKGVAFILSVARLGQGVVVVDEASMLATREYENLVKLGCKLLLVGDPAQLPPVNSKCYITSDSADFTLTEIHRTALESPITRLSLAIRNNESFNDWDGWVVKADHKKIKYLSLFNQVDQVLTWRNATRFAANKRMRGIQGIDQRHPVHGDKMIVLNNKMLQVNNTKMKAQIVNGQQFICNVDTAPGANALMMPIVLENGGTVKPFVSVEPCLANYGQGYKREYNNGLVYVDYAYAITVHKSQGSEWNKVAILDDAKGIMKKHEYRRWLYTAVTRAKKGLVWVSGIPK